MDMDARIIGQRIKAARLSKGMTQEQLAAQLEFATESVAHIEIGSSKTSLSTFIRIAGILEVSLDYLAGITATPTEMVLSDLIEKSGLTPKQESVLIEMAENLIPIVKKICN